MLSFLEVQMSCLYFFRGKWPSCIFEVVNVRWDVRAKSSGDISQGVFVSLVDQTPVAQPGSWGPGLPLEPEKKEKKEKRRKRRKWKKKQEKKICNRCNIMHQIACTLFLFFQGTPPPFRCCDPEPGSLPWRLQKRRPPLCKYHGRLWGRNSDFPGQFLVTAVTACKEASLV